MNKTSIGILSFFILMIFTTTTACKKEYSCKCTGTYMGFSGDTTLNLGKLTKKDAKSQCNNYQNTYGAFAALVGANITCEIK